MTMFRAVVSLILALSISSHPVRAGESPAPRLPGVTVSFDGGRVSNNIALVIRLAARHDLLEFEAFTPSKNSTICGRLAEIGLPAPCEPIAQAIVDINQGNERDVRFPLFNLIRYDSGQKFSTAQAAEVRRSKDMLDNWRDINSKRSGNAVMYDGFQINFKARDDVQAKRFASEVVSIGSSAISVELLQLEQFKSKAHSAFSIDTLKAKCSEGKSLAPIVLDYSTLSDYDLDALQFTKPLAVTGGGKVILADVPLLEAPSFKPVLANAAPVPCKWEPFQKALHHSTHLAGIINSRAEYGFGGLAPNTLIDPVRWAELNDAGQLVAVNGRHGELVSKIMEPGLAPSPPLDIFLAAVSFDPWLFDLDAAGRLVNVAARFSRTLEKRIQQFRPFLVVAAGQPEDVSSQPKAITLLTPEFPQNLGDLPSVLVVSACSDCTKSRPKIWERANYAEGERKLVHIAAPGGVPIPGWVSKEGVSEALGTSQAAAYVAGLASAMVRRFPQSYADGAVLKARLQITSRPLPSDSAGTPHADNDKINAGVVDPILAALDPDQHWLKRNGMWARANIRLITPGALPYLDSSGEQYIKTSYMRRAYRMNGERWTFYLDNSLMNDTVPAGEIKRIGPLQPANNEKLFQLCDGNWVRLRDVDDFIVSRAGLRSSVCPQ